MSTATEPDTGVRRYRAYTVYKDSGVQWLGEIPAHWEVKRLKHVATWNDEVLPERMDSTLEMTYVDISSVDSVQGIVEKERLTFETAPSRARRIVRDGDIIVSTVRTYLRAIASIVQPESDMIVSTGFAVIRPRTIGSAFAAYGIRAPYFVDSVVANSVGVSYPAINSHELVSLPVICPTDEEQEAIVAFLDREIDKIDALVDKKERLLELLHEKRTALITRAVTKGLDPDVPMIDSGVEWLGEIPEHWEVRRVAELALSLQTGPFGSQLHAADYITGGTPVINPVNLVSGTLVPALDRTVDKVTSARLGHHKLLRGDILFARRGDVGRCGLAGKEQEGWLCGTGCLRMRPCPRSTQSAYLLHLLSTHGVGEWLENESVGSTMKNLNTSIIGMIPVAVPGLAEQRRISKFLHRETTKIDALVAKVREAIDCLKELRTAVIAAAVTGKIDVRETPA